jgi:hypothetical protein
MKVSKDGYKSLSSWRSQFDFSLVVVSDVVADIIAAIVEDYYTERIVGESAALACHDGIATICFALLFVYFYCCVSS